VNYLLSDTTHSGILASSATKLLAPQISHSLLCVCIVADKIASSATYKKTENFFQILK